MGKNGFSNYHFFPISSSTPVPVTQKSKGTKPVEQETSGVESKDDGQNPKVVPGPSSAVADGKAQRQQRVQSLTVDHVEFSNERVVRVNASLFDYIDWWH